ncbi:lipopolysaccharide core heptose(I) kinase RfaP [Pseudomonas fuscovaginae UPB0736]|uniref:lipopolysaccharide core heptose(I) kinase RfaP n=1 Tax=Pseudomonas asplenii TaxID=53407 RepID=UPI000289745A|nr:MULTISPECIES: lipopolysaccharide core heptose(I) kinase RfaP [Pseudomonas]UUQ67121.1 lipopolysaccharide core heptose(I) kinase RfaP [Pseudomonas fuscovaginae UPB0736]UZE29611.1 lipopolysaccharide core heptose(I) kinase RfaP [Pseudomonas asplenii]
MKLILAEPFKSLWAERDAFAEVERLQGEVYRELEARRTLRTEVAGHGFFVKIHRGIGWGEIFKNLLTAKLPVLGAGQEWRAIQRLQAAGVPTMTAVAYGERGSNPAGQHSFIVTEELAPTISLEDFSIDWVRQPPEPRLKRALIAEVARMTGMMHRAGVNHRDCYICHFLLHTDKPVTADDFKLSVIDLHRAQTRSVITRRWRNKDLAALYFSALEIGLTRRDKLRFLRDYFQQPLRQILRDEAPLLAWLEGKAERLYQRKQRYGDAL